MAVFRLNQEQWEFVQRFLPEQHMGRPRSRDKECFEAILYVLKTGCQWELLPGEYPPKSTVHRRFKLWKKAKVFYRLFRKTRCPDPAQAVVHIDSTMRLAKRGRQDFQSREVQVQQNNGPVQRTRTNSGVWTECRRSKWSQGHWANFTVYTQKRLCDRRSGIWQQNTTSPDSLSTSDAPDSPQAVWESAC